MTGPIEVMARDTLPIEAAFLLALAMHGIPPDVQELLCHGDGRGTVAPGALKKAIQDIESVGYVIMTTAERDGIRAAAMAEAAEVLDAYGEYDQAMCCDGRECGCQGSSVHQTIQHYILALATTPAGMVCVPVESGLECVAWEAAFPDGEKVWLASTVAHDIMSQGKTYEKAKERLEITIEMDALGRNTNPSPIVKTFRALTATHKEG